RGEEPPRHDSLLRLDVKQHFCLQRLLRRDIPQVQIAAFCSLLHAFLEKRVFAGPKTKPACPLVGDPLTTQRAQPQQLTKLMPLLRASPRLAPPRGRSVELRGQVWKPIPHHRTAIGLPGEPVAPFSRSGAKMNANS